MLGMRQYIREAFDIANTDKGYAHEYEHMYANVLSSFEPKSILEIGVRYGHSIRAWQMLYPKANVVGTDIKKHNLVKGPDFTYHIGDSTNPETAKHLGKFDLIIDDGSHNVIDQISTFNNFQESFNFMYVIEDIGFARKPHPSSEEATKILMSHIQGLGFKGVIRFESYNLKTPSCSLVIQSKEF
jgi:hypothetical protein